jgi:hypothetical protein
LLLLLASDTAALTAVPLPVLLITAAINNTIAIVSTHVTHIIIFYATITKDAPMPIVLHNKVHT